MASSSSASISLMYPSSGPFNVDYFIDTHMPLIQDAWGSEGLQNWEVTEFDLGLPYSVQLTLKFETMKKWQRASTGPSSTRVWGDMANFTTVKPELFHGKVKGSHRTTLKERKIFGDK